ncbi:MAG: hypothetical protein AAGD25_34270 [Cyanobacteria bacterium P01_F01_bin.150]
MHKCTESNHRIFATPFLGLKSVSHNYQQGHSEQTNSISWLDVRAFDAIGWDLADS